MQLYPLAALVGAALAAAPVAATTTTIDFNSETADFAASLSYPGVTLTAPGGSIFTTTFGNTPNGTRGIIAQGSSGFVPFRAAFSTLASAVSIDLGDLGQDEDFLFLRAFDAGNGLLASATAIAPAGDSAMRTLSVMAANIAFVEFGGLGFLGQSNVYADNLMFTTGSNAVPEPASWAMLIAGFGLAGAAMRRRRAALAA
jgi:hypothetical protein